MQRRKISFPFQTLDLLLEDLQQVFRFNYHLIADAGGTLEELQQELMSLKGLMTEMHTGNYESKHIKHLAEKMRRILGEAEIAIDNFVVEAAAQKKSKGWISKAFQRVTRYPTELRDLEKKIALIAEEVKVINQENLKNSFEELRYNQANSSLTRRPPTKLPEISRCDDQTQDERVFGFYHPYVQVVDLLTSGPENLEVISIAGMSGLGKTTLARQVYNDPVVDYKFRIRAFVCVLEEYDERDVLLQILSTFTQISDQVRDMDNWWTLEKHLYSELEGKTYLVVLDDVSDARDWYRLKAAFPNSNRSSRVLITTTNTKVAECANPNNPNSLYRLGLLNQEDSRKLLRHNVFGDDYCPAELEEYETEIVSKCGGLPLTVVLIARVLRTNFDRVDLWKEVAKNFDDVANSVRNDERRDTTYTTMFVQMMYQHLPNYLKPCLLYLGIFPEGYKIPAWKLIQLWISEGFIEHSETIEWEDVAESYLEELVRRNLVLLGRRKKNGKIRTCTLEKIIREFCKKEAAEENLFQEFKQDKINFYTFENSGLDQHRRLWINSDGIWDISGAPSGRSVRSFLTFSKEEVYVEPSHLACIPKTFRLLRVLEVQSLHSRGFPVDIVNLLLLKYLAITSCASSVPSEFSVLQNLQTLIFWTTSRTLQIKADIWSMSQFRHLHVNAIATYPSPDSKKSKEDSSSNSTIQTLCMIAPECCRGEVFERTLNLKKLGVKGALTKLIQENGRSSLYEYLRSSKSLRNLKLLNDEANSRPRIPFEYLPKHLSELTLMKTHLEWTEMIKLGQLEFLQILKLKDTAFQGPSWNTMKGGFYRLEHLQIGETDLIEWEASADHFPKLKSLELKYCDKLNTLPHGLVDIPSLQSVVLYCTNPNVASSARRFQMLKLDQAMRRNERNTFKLSVYPPEH